MKLTDRQIKNLKPKKDRYEVWEGNGFGIRIASSGKKSWVFVYRYEGRPRRLTLGQYPKLSVAAAHAAHGKALADLEMGTDPSSKMVKSNLADKNAYTVANLVNEYLEKWAKPRKRSWKEDQRILYKDIIPRWGSKKAKHIERRHVILLLDEIMERGSPIAANRTLATMRRMFNFAIERDILQNTPCYLVKAPAKENRRERLLNEEEIKIFWNTLDNAAMAELTKLALKLQLVTAQRKGEIVSAEWSEFDLKGGWWEIPSSKAKNNNSHRVPLSELAINLIQEIKNIPSNSRWLFPSPRADKPVTGESVDHALRLNIPLFKGVPPFTPHDLRRTAASHMTALGIPRLVVSKILNHAENSVTSVYDRHSYDKEKRDALNTWCKFLKTKVAT